MSPWFLFFLWAPENTFSNKHLNQNSESKKIACNKQELSMENLQKQPSRCILKERYSENTQQIYRRAPMPKCDSNKVAKELYWNRTLAWVFSCKFAAYFLEQLFLRTPLGGCFWNLLQPSNKIFSILGKS